jgi:hypothetical protein
MISEFCGLIEEFGSLWLVRVLGIKYFDLMLLLLLAWKREESL